MYNDHDIVYFLWHRSIMLYTIPILILSLMILVLRDLFHLSSILNAAITAICDVTYESIFSMGFGVIPNIICAEIFPTSVRGICISICSLTYWICTLIITSLFPFLLQLLGLTGVFGLFVVGCIVSWIFVYLKVPETKGMPLEVIIEFFAIGSKPAETIDWAKGEYSYEARTLLGLNMTDMTPTHIITLNHVIF